MKKIKNKIITFSAAVACIALAGGAVAMLKQESTVTANAITQTMELDDVTFVMDKGASVRKDTPTGLRYRSLMSVEEYNALEANTDTYQQIMYGMLIAPADYLVTYGALNEENVFGETPIYGWEDNEGEAFGGDVQIINVSRTSMVDYTDEEGNPWKAFMGVLTEVKAGNYARDFVGVGYIETIDKWGNVEYKMADGNDNVRNVSYIAQKALLAGESDENSALNSFVQYAYLNDFVESTVNVKETRPIDYAAGSGSFTASANGMYIYLDEKAISDYSSDYDYLRLKLKSTTQAEFRIITTNSSGTENWTYVYKTLNSSEEFLIPLNDASVHDFSKYNLALYAAASGQNVTIESIDFVKLADENALNIFLNLDNWDNTNISRKSATAASVTVGGWEMGINTTALQSLIDLGYTKITAKVVASYRATKVYFEQYGETYASGETVTLSLADWNGKVKAYNDSGHCDGNVTFTDIKFEKATTEDTAIGTIVNASNWVETDGGTVHVNETGADMIVVGGWYFKLTAEAVQELIALGYSEVSFTITSRGYGGSATHFYFAVTEEWYEPGATVTLNLATHKEKGIKIRPATGAASSSNYSDGAIQIENIAFTEATAEELAMATFANSSNWAATDGGSVHVDEVTLTSIKVGGWYFKLTADAVQELVDLGYTEITFTATCKFYGGTTPTHFYVKPNDQWYTSGETVTINLASCVDAGIKMQVGNGSSNSDGSILIENIVFSGRVELPDGNSQVTFNTGTGYTFNGESVYIVGEDYAFNITIADGYDATSMQVFANGTRVYATNGQYVVSNAPENLTISALGVKVAEYSVILPKSTLHSEASIEQVVYGEAITLTISPTGEFSLLVKANGVTLEMSEYNTYVLENVTTNVIVEVFERPKELIEGTAIVIPTDANDTLVYAAEELQYFINEISGQNLPIMELDNAEDKDYTNNIFVGMYNSKLVNIIPATADSLAIMNDDDDVYIGGSTDRGTLYGVYEYLENKGVKFLTSDYTHIPTNDSLTFEVSNVIAKEPQFAYSGYYTGQTGSVTSIDSVKYNSRLRFVHQFTGESMDNIYYAPSGGNDTAIYGEGGTLSTIEATQIRMDWFTKGFIASSHNSLAYAALGVYAMRDSIADWSQMIEFGYATDAWYWVEDSTPDTVDASLEGYSEQNVKALVEGEIAYESIRLNETYILANYSSILYSDGSDICYSSGVLKNTGDTVTALSLVKAGMDYAMTKWGDANTYFMFGYTDQEARCACSTCSETRASWSSTYKYNNTYYYYKFVQALATDMLEKHPDEKVVMWAYASSGEVPSQVSTAISADTIGKLPSNVYVQWAPIWLDEAFALNDTTSSAAKTEVAAQAEAWRSYVHNDQFALWGYENYYFVYANTLDVLAENVEYLKSIGYLSYMVQASNNESDLPELAMKSYVFSKAVWYQGTVTDALVTEWRNEFIRYYYGEEAYDLIVRYYDELNAAYSSTFTNGYKIGAWTLGDATSSVGAAMIPADTLKTLVGYLNSAMESVGADSVYADHIDLLKLSPRYMYTHVYGDDDSGVIGTRGQLKADMLAAGISYVREGVSVSSYFADVEEEIVIDDPALALVINEENWVLTDGGSVHVDKITKESITVGGWYFKLTAEAVQGLVDLGYGEITFTATCKFYGGTTPTHFYVKSNGQWYASGETVTIDLLSCVETGIKLQVGDGSTNSDGSILIENIVFTEAEENPDAAAVAIVVNADNWVSTDGGSVHVNETAANKIVVGGWYFKLTAEAVQELIALGYSEVSFATTSRGYNGSATHAYFTVTGEWYELGATVTLNLEDHKDTGIKIKLATGAASESNHSDGAVQIENIVFTKAEVNPDADAVAIVVNADNWSATDGGTLHVNETESDMIVVGGWYFKLTAEAVQELIALGYSEVSFTITSRGYGGSATHFYFAVTEEWYEPGATVTLNLEAHKEKGIKIRPATGGASESYYSDGAVQIEDIAFTKITSEELATAVFVNSSNWVATDGGTVHVDETAADKIVVGGWYFKLTAEAVQELIALGYSEVSFTITSRGYGGSATHFYFAVTEEWYEPGATVTLNLEAHKEKGIKIRPATGAASSSNYSDGAVQIDNIVFTK